MFTKPSDNFADVDFGDVRISRRTEQVVEDLTKNSQKSILLASGSRTSAKAAYRLLRNKHFTLDKLQGGVARKTRSAMTGIPVVLLVQDTTDVNYNTHKKTVGLGYSSDKVLGIKVHSCIAITPDGVPIGLMAQSCITREKPKDPEDESEKTPDSEPVATPEGGPVAAPKSEPVPAPEGESVAAPEGDSKGTAADESEKTPLSASKKAKRPIEEKESNRWLETMRETTKNIPEGTQAITVCDRECDFYEFYNEAANIDGKFVVRVVNNRVTVYHEKLRWILENTGSAGSAKVDIPRDTRRNLPARTATLEISYAPITLKRPKIRTEDNIAETLTFNVVRVIEKNPPAGVEPIEWLLATNLTVSNAEDAFRIVRYYVERWKIERFHHVLKSGCKVEKIQQRDVKQILPLMLIYSIIALYILSITLAARSFPDMLCDVFFDKNEWRILFQAANRTKEPPKEPYTLAKAIEYVGILAGRTFMPSDGKIGADTIWQGLFALYLLVEYAPFVG
jgi:hypothetical protein